MDRKMFSIVILNKDLQFWYKTCGLCILLDHAPALLSSCISWISDFSLLKSFYYCFYDLLGRKLYIELYPLFYRDLPRKAVMLFNG